MTAMIFVLRSGCPWRALPEFFGPWKTVYSKWRLWCEKGVWGRALKVLSRNRQGVLRFIDASDLKVYQDAHGERGGKELQAISHGRLRKTTEGRFPRFSECGRPRPQTGTPSFFQPLFPKAALALNIGCSSISLRREMVVSLMRYPEEWPLAFNLSLPWIFRNFSTWLPSPPPVFLKPPASKPEAFE